jgi:hypothetical protein
VYICFTSLVVCVMIQVRSMFFFLCERKCQVHMDSFGIVIKFDLVGQPSNQTSKSEFLFSLSLKLIRMRVVLI